LATLASSPKLELDRLANRELDGAPAKLVAKGLATVALSAIGLISLNAVDGARIRASNGTRRLSMACSQPELWLLLAADLDRIGVFKKTRHEVSRSEASQIKSSMQRLLTPSAVDAALVKLSRAGMISVRRGRSGVKFTSRVVEFHGDNPLANEPDIVSEMGIG
jgi:hypothetical protein